MIWYWISFKKWNVSLGRHCVSRRIRIKGYIWTPFIRVCRRRNEQVTILPVEENNREES